ncbi:RnfH family protein [Arhodomonas aquaeolei]|uniref:RnfH family protein n=1 Tax=Arhodomonas aquaeolei TaxID=2369 RepID=UPI00038066B6|nr:RnfH family protein [Arhodomonas aquaeolei]
MAGSEGAAAGQLHVEVAYARPDVQVLIPVSLPSPVTAGEAIEASGIRGRFPEIDLARQTVGVFATPVALDHVLHDGDRVEIYRALQVDPKEMRRRRAGARR